MVVLNWNGADDTLACLESLRRSMTPARAIVVDNGSTDDSLERIERSKLADEIVRNGENLGYAGGNNVGICHALSAGAAVVVVLNNDTIVEPQTIAALVASLPEHELRAVSPDVRYAADPETSWFAGGIVEHGWTRHLQPYELPRDDEALRHSEWLSGCCIAARRETWERVGLFDRRYFLIFEDSDWSLRAVRGGVDLYVAATSRIYHRVSSSFADPPTSLLGAFYFARNGLRLERRWFPHSLPRFVYQWLIRPAPSLVRHRRGRELLFRWLGAFAFVVGNGGRAPHLVEWLAARLAG